MSYRQKDFIETTLMYGLRAIDRHQMPRIPITQHRHEQAVGRLRRAGQRNPAALQLAEKLTNCSDDTPCGSGACPKCGLRIQNPVGQGNSAHSPNLRFK